VGSLLSGSLARLTREIPVHHGPATAAEFCAMFDMHVINFETFGISLLQSRNASPVICCASGLKAWLAVGPAQRPTTKAVVNPAWRTVLCESKFMTHPLC